MPGWSFGNRTKRWSLDFPLQFTFYLYLDNMYVKSMTLDV